MLQVEPLNMNDYDATPHSHSLFTQVGQVMPVETGGTINGQKGIPCASIF